MPKFDGVVTSLSVRYLDFGPSGVPLRATAGVMLEESANLEVDRRRA